MPPGPSRRSCCQRTCAREDVLGDLGGSLMGWSPLIEAVQSLRDAAGYRDEPDILGTRWGVDATHKSPRQDPSDGALGLPAVPGPPAQVDWLLWVLPSPHRLTASVGHATSCTEPPRCPVSPRTPPADKTCLAEQGSCWAVIAETLLWAW